MASQFSAAGQGKMLLLYLEAVHFSLEVLPLAMPLGGNVAQAAGICLLGMGQHTHLVSQLLHFLFLLSHEACSFPFAADLGW